VNVLIKVVDGTEGPNVTFVYQGPAYNFGGFSMNAQLLVLDNANLVAPIDAFTFGFNLSNLGACTASGTITTQIDTLILVIMQPKSDNGSFPGFAENSNFIIPDDPSGLTPVVKARQFADNGLLADSVGIWSKNFVGPGATGNFISPSGWAAGAATANQLVLAIGLGTGPNASATAATSRSY